MSFREITLRRGRQSWFPGPAAHGPASQRQVLQIMRPKADHRLLEDPDTLAQVREDPRGFLDDVRFLFRT